MKFKQNFFLYVAFQQLLYIHHLKIVIYFSLRSRYFLQDPAIPVIPDYKPWTSGLEKEIFVKSAENWPKSMFPESVKGYNITFGKVCQYFYMHNMWEAKLIYLKHFLSRVAMVRVLPKTFYGFQDPPYPRRFTPKRLRVRTSFFVPSCKIDLYVYCEVSNF